MAPFARTSCVLLLAAAACHAGPSPREATSPPAPPAFTTLVEGTLARMHQRFDAARHVEEALVWGDLATAQAEARRLSQIEDPDALAAWQPYFARVRDAALAVESAGTLVTAARRSVELATACADCHTAIGAHPHFAAPAPPTAGSTVAAQMQSHQWGAARMWEGLIAPDPARWTEGATALVQAPFVLSAPDEDRLSDDMTALRTAMADRLATIRDYAGQALTPLQQGQRAELYGQMLVTCADCHALVRDGRRAERD